MQSIRLSHSNRPALLRCYINSVTSPSLQPCFLGPPNSRRLMSTRNFVPCFLLPRFDPPCFLKTLALAQRGPVRCVSYCHLVLPTARAVPATPCIYNLHHKQQHIYPVSVHRGNKAPFDVDTGAAVSTYHVICV